MTFYLKYRPQTIDDLDTASVRETLSNIIKSGNIPHALLFTGPKGIGKTSTARILAKIINCTSNKAMKPCNNCSSCLSITSGTNMDVIEMDAASNRGIDDVRVLRDVVKLAPSSLRAKVYIIDEAHMLTTEASNALLKTLEEPPAHVYFILATTNPEKLIDTIKSRTILIQFTKATIDETKRSLQRIIKSEKLDIKEENLKKIIKIARGSFRDAVKLLEQYSKDENFLKNQNILDAENFVSILLSKDVDKALSEVASAIKNGVSAENITMELLTVLQVKLLDEKSDDLIKLIGLILSVQEYNKVTPIEELPLELAVIKWCNIK
ncbi:MAG: DNA polymerase III subunit gamma/tau [Patescibacteria group bacterium]